MAGCLRNVYSVSCQAVGKIALHVSVCVKVHCSLPLTI